MTRTMNANTREMFERIRRLTSDELDAFHADVERIRRLSDGLRAPSDHADFRAAIERTEQRLRPVADRVP